jgi:hypothetical protein
MLEIVFPIEPNFSPSEITILLRINTDSDYQDSTMPTITPPPSPPWTSAPYSSEHFHTTPSISSAGTHLRDRDAQAFIDSTLGPLIKQHSMQSFFGVGLVHLHFDLADDEIIVDYNGTSTPWATKGPSQLEFNGGTNSLKYPVAWMLQEDAESTSADADAKFALKWIPHEFAFSPLNGRDAHVVGLDEEAYLPFIIDFHLRLETSPFSRSTRSSCLAWRRLLGLSGVHSGPC